MNLTQSNPQDKSKLFQRFIQDLGSDTESEQILVRRKGQITDVGLVNIYKDPDLLLNLPTIWTDWWSRLNSRLMIIGQDWGPEVEMRKLCEEYLAEVATSFVDKKETRLKYLRNYKKQGRTTVDLIRYLEGSAKEMGIVLDNDFIDEIYITMAVMFARRGHNYRGNSNFDSKLALAANVKHMQTQIEIVRPDVILALGGLALEGLSKIYGFEFDGKLSSFIESKYPKRTKFGNSRVQGINPGVKDVYIIPAYHPAAHIAPKKQLTQYHLMWEVLSLSDE